MQLMLRKNGGFRDGGKRRIAQAFGQSGRRQNEKPFHFHLFLTVYAANTPLLLLERCGK